MRAAILFEPPFDDATHPQRRVDVCYLQRTRFESIAKRNLRRRREGTRNPMLLLTKQELTERRFRAMNTDWMKGNWKQFVGKAKEKWGRLTNDDWQVVEGKRDQLVGKIQEKYGITREEAERQLGEFER